MEFYREYLTSQYVKIHRWIILLFFFIISMKYGVSQEVYTIHYNETQGKQKLPKYLKCDTSKKNQNIQKKYEN